MRKVRVAINGFGRVGRTVLRCSIGDPAFDFVAINELADIETLAHLLRYDSVHRRLGRPVEVQGGDIMVAGDRIRILSEKDPARIPWDALGVDVVIESTGVFLDREGAQKHLLAGAGRVLITAPAKDPDVTIVLGVNDSDYDPAKHRIVSNASCTTNCAAPVAKVLHEAFGIRRGFVSTTHSLTNDQKLLDLPHKDLRRARAAGLSMIPTKTGAAKSIGDVIPELAGKLDGLAVRVPTEDVSLIDFVVELERDASVAAINEAFTRASESEPLKGILEVTNEPLVSVDFVGTAASATVDLPLTRVIDDRLAKVFAWYDNEWGYACRCRDLAKRMVLAAD